MVVMLINILLVSLPETLNSEEEVNPLAVLLEAEGKLTPISSKTQLTYQFQLNHECEFLDIDFKYAPKQYQDKAASHELIMEAIEKYAEPEWAEPYKKNWEGFYPLQNLLTLSVDGPEGFRGSAHRHPPEQQHRICSDASQTSPGFISGKLAAGVWKITISVHCVVTPECRYVLEVRGGEAV